ncbi:acyl-CoA Delta(11) desaturase-like [Cimex lectularius]|uniref:Fatty acid desaturase domain-containing protein n=1 Tax=Cimex lectularius TaxID=79782 RepID=A0A8I6RWK6_CIMLE|nr:acyl-CoA Delta(11) desaturase-like [Cimex lectularius]
MAPNITSSPEVTQCPVKPLELMPEKEEEYKLTIVWRNVILFAYLHLAAVYGLYSLVFEAQWKTVLFVFVLYQMSALGITAGAHRLWSHRAYKAKLPLRILLAFFNTLAFQNHVIEWARDHRVHHKYSETDADPHNATRGFFFAHVGWLLCRKHPELKRKGKQIDMSDLENDPVLAFQKKYYLTLMPVVCFILPAIVPMYFWGETFTCAWFTASMFRYTLTLNLTWLVNSAAHMWGNKPYDATINPAENLGVALGAAGEGWHNYHHVFPWDYKAAELGNYRANTTTAFIDLMAKIGWAYDLKTVPHEIINKRCQRTGDGTRPLWGWGDKDMTQEDAEGTIQLLQSEKAE